MRDSWGGDYGLMLPLQNYRTSSSNFYNLDTDRRMIFAVLLLHQSLDIRLSRVFFFFFNEQTIEKLTKKNL